MANFKIGDRVKIIILEDEDKTGIIVAKGDMPNAKLYKLEQGKPPEEERQILWWKVKLDGTVEEKDFPDDKLVLIN